jgi:hypothetical protein
MIFPKLNQLILIPDCFFDYLLNYKDIQIIFVLYSLKILSDITINVQVMDYYKEIPSVKSSFENHVLENFLGG